jgi:hypothetical protein
MSTLATAIVVTAALAGLFGYLVVLARMIWTNRPAALPRSHEHEIDPMSRRLTVL